MIHYERHPDDDIFDLLQVQGDTCNLEYRVEPRYKTSGLSGNEWRTSYTFTNCMDTVRQYNDLRDAGAHLPLYLLQQSSIYRTGVRSPTTVLLSRKRTLLVRREYPSMLAAVSALPWLLRTHFEDCRGAEQKAWYARIEQDHTTCHQPGCADPATVVYRMKRHSLNEREPTTDASEYRRAFCARHSTRGDQDWLDCDDNYVMVKGHTEAPLAQDVKPAVFGGVISFKDDE